MVAKTPHENRRNGAKGIMAISVLKKRECELHPRVLMIPRLRERRQYPHFLPVRERGVLQMSPQSFANIIFVQELCDVRCIHLRHGRPLLERVERMRERVI